jgi:hypothetical protein
VWSRRPVVQAGIAFGLEPRDPAVGALARETQFLGDMSDRSAVVDHT